MSAADNKSLIFIPDISGFTRFLGKTEIDHSRHIIAELLEILIDTNEIGLTVAEIEGDAILFYQENSNLSIDEILSQVKLMFIRFHEHLRLYESRRICDCGACTVAVRLSIKFVVHFAEFGIIEVKHFRKPYGYEVVRAHRLLKNNLNEVEYVLITDSSVNDPFNSFQNSIHVPWFTPQTSSVLYENLGETAFHYSLLDKLHSEVNDPPPLPHFEKSENPVIGEIFIKTKLDVVFDALSNFEQRLKWQSGIKGMLFDSNKVNRVGTQHTCLIGSNRLEIETVNAGRPKPDKKTLAEKTSTVPFKMVKELITYFELTQKEQGTHVRLEVHYQPQPFPRAFLAVLFRKNFEKGTPGFLQELKDFCEKQ